MPQTFKKNSEAYFGKIENKGDFYRVFYEEPVSSGPTCQLSRLELIYFDDAFYYAKKWAFEKYVHCTVKIIANHGVKISSEGGFKKSQCLLEPSQNTICPVLIQFLVCLMGKHLKVQGGKPLKITQ